MKFVKRFCALGLSAALLLGGAGCSLSGSPKEPTTVTIWHYYNGAQQQTFNELVARFNETIGSKRNIIVESVSQGGVNDVSSRLADALDGKAGASAVPNAAALYADAAYGVYKREQAVDLTSYLSKKELSEYIPAYLDEGRFAGGESTYLFPVAKSTEVFMLNETDWETFATATGVTEEAFKTWEGITAISQKYYEWTDAQTPDIPNDGKAFFGRDAMANYLIIGALQLGKPFFAADESGNIAYQYDANVLRRIWDNYYVPYVNGWFTSAGRFRSDDVKTGDCLALVGSTSSATYFPTEVTRADGTAYPISAKVYPLPNFENTEPYAVQQGASMLVLKSDKAHESATVEFLKWFTQQENDLSFCLGSGYLPVLTVASNENVISQSLSASTAPISDALRQTLVIGAQMAQEYTFYTSPAFQNGDSARSIIDKALSDKATADREQVLALTAQGMNHKDAAAKFTTDENFSIWASSLKASLEALF